MPVVFPLAKEIGIHPVHFNIVLTAAVGIGLFLLASALASASGGSWGASV